MQQPRTDVDFAKKNANKLHSCTERQPTCIRTLSSRQRQLVQVAMRDRTKPQKPSFLFLFQKNWKREVRNRTQQAARLHSEERVEGEETAPTLQPSTFCEGPGTRQARAVNHKGLRAPGAREEGNGAGVQETQATAKRGERGGKGPGPAGKGRARRIKKSEHR